MKFANCHDTLLAHHAFASHLPQRLDHVASCYTDSRPWKRLFTGGSEDEKGSTPDQLSGEDLCKYNAADARLTMLSWQRMQSDLEPERAVYEHDQKLAAVCREMIRAGIGVDEERKNELSDLLAERCDELRDKMRRMVNDPHLVPGSHRQIRKHLFGTLGARFVAVTPKGLAATSNETLEGLRMGGNQQHAEFATALLTWRVADKVKSTYVGAIGGPGKKGVHLLRGRAHYNWKPFGTVSGRLSCRLQSVPRYSNEAPESRVREIYVPRKNHTFVYYDVSQAEMRLAAYLSNDATFIEACRGDVHANNAKAVFPVAARMGLLDGASMKDPTRGKKFRDIAKNLGFAISYYAEAEKVFATLRSKGFDVSFQAVTLILSKLRSAYRTYYRWVNTNHARVQQVGYMRTPFLGRIRWLGWYPKTTEVANYPIQSGLADIMNARTIELSESIIGPYLVAQVHDACIYDVPNDLLNAAKEIISEIWSRPIDTAGGKLILPVDFKYAERWSDL